MKRSSSVEGASFDILADEDEPELLPITPVQETMPSHVFVYQDELEHRRPPLDLFVGSLAARSSPVHFSRIYGTHPSKLIRLVITSLEDTTPYDFVSLLGHFRDGSLLIWLGVGEKRRAVEVNIVRWIKFCRLLVQQKEVDRLRRAYLIDKNENLARAWTQGWKPLLAGLDALHLTKPDGVSVPIFSCKSDEETVHLYAKLLSEMGQLTREPSKRMPTSPVRKVR